MNGITGLEIILSGYILGFILIFKHARKAPNKKVKKIIILSEIGLIALFQAWFGVSASFLLMILGFPPLGYPAGDPNIGVLAYAWGPAIGVPIWAYIISNLFKKGRYKIPITGIFVVLSIIFAVMIYTFPSISTSWKPMPEFAPVIIHIFPSILIIYILNSFYAIIPKFDILFNMGKFIYFFPLNDKSRIYY